MITCIDPLDPEQHPAGDLVNIVTGKVTTDPKVNVDQVITITTSDIKAGWASSFHASIQKRVQRMARVVKHQNVEGKFAATETYARAMVSQKRSSDLDIKSLMKHELAFYLASLFTNTGVYMYIQGQLEEYSES
jgi:hypothetical protein